VNMDDAVQTVEEFLEEYSEDNDWAVVEIRVLPSGDENDTIKVWISFDGDSNEDDLDALKKEAIDALRDANPELDDFSLEVRTNAV